MLTIGLQGILNILNDAPGTSDPRMNRFLMGSPLQFVGIIILYLLLIYAIGPKFMRDKKPYSLRRILIIYNIVQILANGAAFYKSIPLFQELNVFCTPPNISNTELSLLGIQLHYCYILLKYLDLIETVFYVLRKKERQISFLHVYHHIGILIAAWISGKYFPGGQAIFVGLYNTIIHCIMYCYYLATSWNRHYHELLWWKKYVTVLQIIQHCAIFLSVFPVVLNVNCTYPKGWMAIFSLNTLCMLYLFTRFYKNNYLQNNKRK